MSVTLVTNRRPPVKFPRPGGGRSKRDRDRLERKPHVVAATFRVPAIGSDDVTELEAELHGTRVLVVEAPPDRPRLDTARSAYRPVGLPRAFDKVENVDARQVGFDVIHGDAPLARSETVSERLITPARVVFQRQGSLGGRPRPGAADAAGGS